MSTSARYSRFTLLAILGLCLMTASCSGSKVTKATADKISTGMTEADVSAILGPPTESEVVKMPDFGGLLPGGIPGISGVIPKEAKNAVWKDGEKNITILFVDGKVKKKETKGF